jgi:kinesin family protein 11
MSGDISDVVPVPDGAGIIPRALHALFGRLDGDEAESSVKCSFIELYNEELRDLLSSDDSVKLKIYEETNNKKGHVTTMVQGMEESHIVSASKGIQLLREGSHKRQVAATKCNDLSSRSHTIFTVTVYMKRTTDTGEDFVSTGKLNLVDLAGSENIQRSGAENKRATEAGLINKSLLTLGRVINSLVDRNSHIPYRESKLTRLLQDSLGGPTKTCIIATLSPAKSNLEETISTLDYAFRAKNIRNKPQVNQLISKKTMLKEFTWEIEKLRTELIATRQRNGVYLTQEAYEDLQTESESRRILSEEQRDKILAMEINLRNKVQELFNLTNNFNNLKRDSDMTKMMLDGTKSILEKTEAVLDHTRKNLADETHLRRAHQQTEENLHVVGKDLLSTLGRTTTDIDGLHSKLRRRSHLHSTNRQQWASTQSQVSDTTRIVEDRLSALQEQQEKLIADLTQRMQGFVQDELQKLKDSQEMLQDKAEAFEKSQAEVNEQTSRSRDDVNSVLEEIKLLREDVKNKVGAGLEDLSAAAEKISAGILTEIDGFHTQLHTSYASLGRDFKTTFDDLVRQMNEQQTEAEQLREQMSKANEELAQRNYASNSRLAELIEQEREQQASEREALMSQISTLINSTTKKQQDRVAATLDSVRIEFDASHETHSKENESFVAGSSAWSSKAQEMVGKVVESRESVKNKIKTDFAVCSTSL